MKPYLNEKEDVLKYYNVDYNGLDKKKIKESIKKFGKNIIKEKPRKSKAKVFLEQYEDFLVIILIISAIISLFTGGLESAIVIFFVITLNSVLGTIQYFKAEKSLKSLKSMFSSNAKVIRDGEMQIVSSKDLVCGDIVVLESGDVCVIDGRILECVNLEVNESSITGESLSVFKNSDKINDDNVETSEITNMIFSGSSILKGKALVVVTNIGDDTQIGKIASMMGEDKEKRTPLQISLDEFSKRLAVGIIGICLLVFILGIYKKQTIIDSLLFAVALAVAAIPEALSTIVTIVLAIGTEKMASENAIVKELKAVEALGSVTVICSDKTGTLTQNKMEVTKVFAFFEEIYKISTKKREHVLLLNILSLCNDINYHKGSDVLENALISYCQEYLDVYKLKQEYPKIHENPFDSNRKMMSTFHNIDGKNLVFVKGGSDVVVSKCSRYINYKGIYSLNESIIERINEKIDEYSYLGLRVIAVAFKEVTWNHPLTAKDEEDLIFAGIVAFQDPPKKETKEALFQTFKAGIRTIMITGDYKITALSIAKEVGLTKNDETITGDEINQLSLEQLKEKVRTVDVFSRVSPEHKIKIVRALQENGEVVAFIGDGVNDAPAIKMSDIGLSMGKGGTDVSKEASSIILTDDNYKTVVKAVANGRNIYKNIQNAIRFLISGNLAGILVVLYTSLLALPIPFAAVHLLFINLLTDSLPAIAIGMEEASEDLLSKKPRRKNSSIISRVVAKKILFEGSIIGICTIIAFYIGLKESTVLARTMAFSTLCIARLFHSFNCKGEKSIFKYKKRNPTMILSFLIGIVLINSVLFIPFLKDVFYVATLSKINVFYIYLLAFTPSFIIQVILLFSKKN